MHTHHAPLPGSIPLSTAITRPRPVVTVAHHTSSSLCIQPTAPTGRSGPGALGPRAPVGRASGPVSASNPPRTSPGLDRTDTGLTAGLEDGSGCDGAASVLEGADGASEACGCAKSGSRMRAMMDCINLLLSVTS